MNRENLIKVYIDTCEKSKYLNTKSLTIKHSFSEIIETGKNKQNSFVINSDTISAALKYKNDGKTCILNMASYKKAGGGVAGGAMAQEESIFRCSTLNNTITQNFYPLQSDEALYTKDAKVFKDRYFNLIEPFEVDCITIAAISLNLYGEGYSKHQFNKTYENTKEYDVEMRNKIKLMLSLASKNGVDNLILGAWGCGVFNNEPHTIANMFKDELENGYNFKNVVFAIINDNNSVSDNYSVFNSII